MYLGHLPDFGGLQLLLEAGAFFQLSGQGVERGSRSSFIFRHLLMTIWRCSRSRVVHSAADIPLSVMSRGDDDCAANLAHVAGSLWELRQERATRATLPPRADDDGDLQRSWTRARS